MRSSPILAVLLFGLACSLITWFALRMLAVPMTATYWCVLGYFTGISLVLHVWQERALVTEPKGFVRRFMGGLVIKLLVSLVLMVVLLKLLGDAPFLKPLLITFVLLYLAFLGFSTARLITMLRQSFRS